MNDHIKELYVSSVLGKKVINDQGQEIGRLWDLLMIPGEVFPEVSAILVKRRKRIFSVSWKQVILFNRFVISVDDRSQAVVPHEPREGEILVRRDILDKQIVDVNGAKVVRVNDLKLGGFKDLLCIFSVDIGFRGLVRRLGHESFFEKVAALFKRDLHHQEISWEYVQALESNSSRLTLTVAQDQMSEMHPADIAGIISQLPHMQVRTVLESLDTDLAGEAIHELEPELRTRIMNQLDTEQASDILEEMHPDEAADILSDLPEERAQELLGLMDAEEAEDIQELMEHEEDTAGGLMNNNFLALSINMTVGEALAEVRAQAPEIETVYYGYILDEEERLLGVASLKELVLTPPEVAVSEIMSENLKTVDIDTEPEDILELIAKYDLIAIPVLEEDGKMAGIVTIDDVLELFLPYALKRRRHHH